MSGLLLPRRLKGSKLSGSFQAYPHANSLQNGTNQAGTLLLLITCPSRLPAYKGQLATCSLLDIVRLASGAAACAGMGALLPAPKVQVGQPSGSGSTTAASKAKPSSRPCLITAMNDALSPSGCDPGWSCPSCQLRAQPGWVGGCTHPGIS